jgi:predicted RNA methylase
MLAVLALVLLAGASIVWQSLALGIGPVPTSAAVRAAVLDLVPADLQGDVHELGAGWGGLALGLARRCGRARVIAWERSPVPFLVLWLRRRASGLPNLEVRFADLYEVDLAQAAAAVCYLFPGAMTRLEPALRRASRPDFVVVTHTFGLRGWRAEKTTVVLDLYRTPVYVYRLPPTAGSQPGVVPFQSDGDQPPVRQVMKAGD